MTASTRVSSSGGLAGRALLASAVLAAIGVVFLVAMFVAFGVGATSTGQALGRINDTLIMVAYPLAIPGLLALRTLVRPGAPVVTDLATVLGVGAIVAITILQAALVAEWLTFEEQIGPASVAILLVGVSLVVIGSIGRSNGVLPHGLRMGLIGATYFGYPLWAWWAGRRLGEEDR